ncbi:MAG TPA: hypothetical protein VNT79_04255 [Phycisphaerae bacterium]|nr:hypothetical protein [Phycisphaerae bacterium]
MSISIASTIRNDQADRVDSHTQAFLVDAASYVNLYDYVVAANDVRRITEYPGGREVTHASDQRLRLSSVTGGNGIGATWGHDVADRRTSAALANGIATTVEYDLNDRLTKIKRNSLPP